MAALRAGLPVITNFCDFGGYKSTFLKPQRQKFGVRVQTWETLLTTNYVEIA